jgi:hypothetical protein
MLRNKNALEIEAMNIAGKVVVVTGGVCEVVIDGLKMRGERCQPS